MSSLLGIIRVLTHQDQNFIEEHGRLIHRAYGLNSISRAIPDQPKGIFDEASETLAIPKIIALGQQLQTQCDVLFLSCAADPGLAELRKAVNIPVVSAGSAAASIAAMLQRPVAVMGIGAEAPRPFKQILGESVIYARPEGVKNTTDLLTSHGRQSALACADQLYRQGIEVIAFSCTGFSTIGLADAINQQLGQIAIDAVQSAGLFASQLSR